MHRLKLIGAAAALLLLALALSGYLLLRASLPPLDGALRQPQLSAPVRITRDARGVPTIVAANRLDLAYATGFVHAQDRYFQMDLARRHAAGELAELFGPVALDEDRRTRLFRFRSLAREVLAAGTAEQRAVIAAYTRGANAGLASLGSRPWEYWVLRQPPAPWLPRTSCWSSTRCGGICRRAASGARSCGTSSMRAWAERSVRLGWKCALAFFYPLGTSWDAPVTPRPPPRRRSLRRYRMRRC